ncbi:MAG: hypothetical protein B6D34_09635 [Candidatus Brocadia sp. UTAMX1]|nr:MAG: hypothetical protein B6D34_09635 [Candidatus Brocadia sp. UTAMX1]
MYINIFKKKGQNVILVIWFLLCIFPGDCFLLGCGAKDLSHQSAEKEAIILTHADSDISVAMADLHCTNCCLLCSHNIVVDLCYVSSFFLVILFSRFKAFHFSHFKNILSAIIYHPPRLTT